jgi:hypothetical protein
MNSNEYTSLADQVARQTPELAALDAQIAAWTPPEDEPDAVHPLKAQADAIRAAIAQCQQAMDESGLTVDTAAVKLATEKAAMWERIKTERDRRQSDGGVEVGGKWFQSNDREAGRYNLVITAAAAAGAPGTHVMRAAWRTMEEGVTQDMTANLARTIILTGLTQFAAIDDAAQAHRAAMEASDNPLAYDFTGGWPASFGG